MGKALGPSQHVKSLAQMLLTQNRPTPAPGLAPKRPVNLPRGRPGSGQPGVTEPFVGDPAPGVYQSRAPVPPGWTLNEEPGEHAL